jgi:acetyl esterase/lipase
MRLWISALSLLAVSAAAYAQTTAWQPVAEQTQVPIWPGAAPDAQPVPGPETSSAGWVTNVTRPTITVYAATGKSTGAVVVVFPGGGFEGLAMDLEGTEACDWLTSRGITCVLLKYRIPSLPYDWRCDCRPDNLVIPTQALEDAQRTMGLVRLHAQDWHIDPHRVGVLGFSAGGYLVAEISTHFAHRLYPLVDAADQESARPDFAMAIYPGHLAAAHDRLNPNVPVSRETPPTLLVQAEDDYVDGVSQSLVYYTALARTRVPAELHLYARGGHAFGLRRTKDPITDWPQVAEAWLRNIKMLPRLAPEPGDPFF